MISTCMAVNYERSALLIYDGKTKRVRKKRVRRTKSAVADRGGAVTGQSYS